MKKLILLLAIFLYPLQAWSLSEEGIKEFSKKAILDCDNYGSESLVQDSWQWEHVLISYP